MIARRVRGHKFPSLGRLTIPLLFLVGRVISLPTPEPDASQGFDAPHHWLDLDLETVPGASRTARPAIGV